MTTTYSATIRDRVQRIETMPAIPAVFMPLLELLSLPAERVKLDEVVKLVSYDNTMAAQCLRVASSPLFGLAKSPESIKGAVISLGLRKVETILLTYCLGNAFPAKNWALDPIVFWRHSLGCAMVCRKFSEKLHLSDLLCRMRGLGYGYYERRKADFIADPAWAILLKEYLDLAGVDLVRFTFELDEAVAGIFGLVATIFGPTAAQN